MCIRDSVKGVVALGGTSKLAVELWNGASLADAQVVMISTTNGLLKEAAKLLSPAGKPRAGSLFDDAPVAAAAAPAAPAMAPTAAPAAVTPAVAPVAAATGLPSWLADDFTPGAP